MFKYIITTLFISFWIIPASSQNLNFVERILNDAEKKSVTLKSPALATLWGGQRRFKLFNNNQGKQIPFETNLFKSGHLDIYLRKTNSKNLIVFMPGIFGSIHKGLTPQMIDQIEKTEFNLLVLPNLLSPEHIKAYPLYGHNPITTEVQILEEALEFTLRELGPSLSNIHIIAESLGSAIGSAWASYDRVHKKRIKSLTLLWPPLELHRAMKNFDKVTQEHQGVSKECGLLKKGWLLLTELTLREFPSNLSKYDQLCLGSIVLIDGFISKAQKSWLKFAEMTGKKDSMPESFEGFFKIYRKELWDLIQKRDESTKLVTWLKKLKNDPNFKLTVLTSKNDFLNDGIDLNNFKIALKLTEKEFYIFPWGGHSGPVGMDNFLEILKYLSPAFSI